VVNKIFLLKETISGGLEKPLDKTYNNKNVGVIEKKNKSNK